MNINEALRIVIGRAENTPKLQQGNRISLSNLGHVSQVEPSSSFITSCPRCVSVMAECPGTFHRNALSLLMLESLLENITNNVDSQELRAIIIRANGPVFSSGHDLKELTSESGRAHQTQVFDRCSELMQTVQDITVPVIAEVRGLATAAGCQLVASCDVAIASENAKFATPGVNVGLFCSTPAVALARSVPRKAAMHMLFTGEPITAQEALLHGLVSKVVPEDKLEEESQRLCERICETSRMVVALGKACFYSQIQLDRNSAYRQASQVMVSNLQLADGQEGIRAFVEKRRPIWTHGSGLAGDKK